MYPSIPSIHPFYNDIGKMKVSEAIPMLGFFANDYKRDFAVLPLRPDGEKNIHIAVWRNNELKILERIMRNCQRKN